MSEKQSTLVVNRTFDPNTCRHAIQGVQTVLHCHHYLSLSCQLADDCDFVDGKQIMRGAAEDTFYPMFKNYFCDYKITDIKDRVSIVEQLYVLMGLGDFKFEYFGNDSAKAIMAHSHVDQGWIKKWGVRERGKPVNFVTQGILQAAFNAVNDLPKGSAKCLEIKSIVCGDKTSQFTIVLK